MTLDNITWEDWPRCAKCRMPVEKFYVQEDTEIILVAECHGDKQVVIVPDEVLETMSLAQMEFGAAFEEETNREGIKLLG
jgi:hypothetical protein